MILLIYCVAISCYLLYASSNRLSVQPSDTLRVWLQSHAKYTKLTGFLLLVISLLTAISSIGVGFGIFTVILSMMCVWSLLIILSPLRIFRYKHIVALAMVLYLINYYF